MISFVVIGLGHIGRKHIQAIRQIDNAQVIATIDPLSTEGIKDTPHFSSLIQYLQSHIHLEQTETVVAAICSPNYLHASQAIQCMHAGMHVLIEKPMTIHSDEAEQIIEASLETHRCVFCVMQLRHSPIQSRLRQALSEGRLGDIRHIDVQCYWNRGDAYYAHHPQQWRGHLAQDGGPLYTQFSHFIDMLYAQFGVWEIDYARFVNYAHQHSTEFEDTGELLFHIKDISGHMFYTTATYDKNYQSHVTIMGSRGTMTIGGQYFHEIIHQHPTVIDVQDLSDHPYFTEDNYAHRAVYHNLINHLNSSETIRTNAIDGLRVVSMIDQAYRYR